MSLEELWLAAWIEGLTTRTPHPPVRPVEHRTGRVLLRDTPAAYVPLTDEHSPLRPITGGSGARGGDRG